jgi:hypothetical protein
MRFVRLTMAAALMLTLGACVVAPPAPYPVYGDGYGYGYPGYYGPGYVAGPTVVIGGGWGGRSWR